MIAALVSAVQVFSKNATGMNFTFISLENDIAISTVANPSIDLQCVLFHDDSDGPEFGQVIASQLLNSFVEAFPNVNFSHPASLNAFSTYSNKILEALRGTIPDVLTQLRSTEGVLNTIVVTGETKISSGSVEGLIELVANFERMRMLSDNLFDSVTGDDQVQHFTMEMGSHRFEAHKVGGAGQGGTWLLVVLAKNRDPSVYSPSIEKASDMLSKIFLLLESLEESY
ncbi:saccharopine dehydrogenase [Pelomyxa schiedti]|nr:saccharopine dehydrogenase [Pelomyxa schiedti]